MTGQVPIVLVAPHPDDEGQALGFLEEVASLAAVVTLTLGEATKRRRTGDDDRATATRRIASWHQFLDAALGLGRGSETPLPRGRVWRGSRPARYAMDGGDGRLSQTQVVALLGVVLDDLAPEQPIDLVLCAYDADDYRHADHAVVAASAAALLADQRVRRVLVRMADGEAVRAARPEFFQRMMARDGAFQRAYGWLAPDSVEWPVDPDLGLFPRVARFHVWQSA